MGALALRLVSSLAALYASAFWPWAPFSLPMKTMKTAKDVSPLLLDNVLAEWRSLETLTAYKADCCDALHCEMCGTPVVLASLALNAGPHGPVVHCDACWLLLRSETPDIKHAFFGC